MNQIKIAVQNRIYFHRWELIKNLFKFTLIWELKLKNLAWVVKFMNLISQVNFFLMTGE